MSLLRHCFIVHSFISPFFVCVSGKYKYMCIVLLLFACLCYTRVFHNANCSNLLLVSYASSTRLHHCFVARACEADVRACVW
jgi:hypothetical protein